MSTAMAFVEGCVTTVTLFDVTRIHWSVQMPKPKLPGWPKKKDGTPTPKQPGKKRGQPFDPIKPKPKGR